MYNRMMHCLVSLTALVLCCSFAHAAYPEKPIDIIIPFAAGGGADQAVRTIEKDFAEEFGQPLVFVYKPGADSAIGTTEIAKRAKPDGYTIAATNYNLVLMNMLRGTGRYTIESFDHIACPVSDDMFILARADSPIKSMRDLIERAKKNPNRVTIGTTETLGQTYIPCLQLREAGVPFVIVQHQGGAAAVPALLGGHVDALGATKGVFFKALSKYRPLAVAALERDPDLPDVPTLKELGYDIQSAMGRGYLAPAGLPREVLERLEIGFKNIYSKPEVIQRLKNIGMTVRWVGSEGAKKMYYDTKPIYEHALEEYNKTKK